MDGLILLAQIFLVWALWRIARFLGTVWILTWLI
jgi:hypothetical protein